jgi:hypothetical protein
MTTPDQLKVSAALEELKFEQDDSGPVIPGSPTKYVATDETVEFLKGKVVTVDASGSVTVKK